MRSPRTGHSRRYRRLPTDLVASIRGSVVKVSYFHGMAAVALDELRANTSMRHRGILTTRLDSIRPAFRGRALELTSLLGTQPPCRAAVMSAGGHAPTRTWSHHDG